MNCVEVRVIQRTDGDYSRLMDEIYELESMPELYDTDGASSNWFNQVFVNHGLVVGAFNNTRLIGVIETIRDFQNPEKAYGIGICIHPDYQGEGISKLLFNETFEVLKNNNVRIFEGLVSTTNYRQLRNVMHVHGLEGFEFRRDEYGPGINRLNFIKNLLKKYVPISKEREGELENGIVNNNEYLLNLPFKDETIIHKNGSIEEENYYNELERLINEERYIVRDIISIGTDKPKLYLIKDINRET